jgi:hypothetical protein
MRRLAVVALGLSALSLSACQLPAASKAPGLTGARAAVRVSAREAATDLYPVIPGARWEYVLQQKQGDNPVQERPMSIAIVSAEARPDGATLAVTERRYENWSPPRTRVLRYPDKVVLSRLSDPEDGPSITIMQLPLKAGRTWPGRPLEGGNSETLQAMGVETVKVPAGSYQAQRVDHLIRYSNGATDTLSYWYAPGVGVVKMIERSTLFQEGGEVHLEVTGLLKAYSAP